MQQVCFAAVSHTEKSGLMMPKDRKDFARMLNVATMEVADVPRFSKIPLKAILVSKEPHQSGHYHYHGIMISATRVSSWSEVV